MQFQFKDNYKIYSRPRLNIGPFKNLFKYKSRRKNVKMMHIYVIIFIAILFCYSIWNFINPIFETLCVNSAKSTATFITNEEVSNIIRKYNYDSFFTISKDNNGYIQMINANILTINQVTSDIAINIQKRLDENHNNKIFISSGAITGISFLSGIGPKIGMKVVSSGNIDTNLRSEFISQGINQTIHRVYLDIRVKVSILTSLKTMQETIENQVLIAENVIVGEIPSAYYNFKGINEEESLRTIE